MTTQVAREVRGHHVVARLIEAVGERVDTTLDQLEAARADKSGYRAPGRPLAVVHADSVADVQRTMEIASATQTPVVTRGAGTGAAGAAAAGEGEIVLSTLRMNRVLEVAPQDRLAVVEPGIINSQLNEHLAQYGLWWPPDPASKDISTVGGNIATGAGGLLCAKYGTVRRAVRGLDIVLADGRLLRTGHRSIKGESGLDLTSLIIGSEGRLGVVVAATLDLQPARDGRLSTVAARFDTIAEAARACAQFLAEGIQPAIAELMDHHCFAAASAVLGIAVPHGDTSAHLTVQTDGPAHDAEAHRIAEILRAAGGEVSIATDPAEGEAMLALRRSVQPGLERMGPSLVEDISVPLSAMVNLFAAINEIEQRYQLHIPTVAHAADGNVHPNFILPPDADPAEMPEDIRAAADELFQTALRLGGTLSGEHGVGVLKRQLLPAELGADQLALQQQIARVFDPLEILNPGKVF